MSASPKIQIELVIEVDETEGSAEELLKDLRDYLTGHETPLWADYGPEAWGGYEGARIKDVRIWSSSVDRS
jgi:hypothetical protein